MTVGDFANALKTRHLLADRVPRHHAGAPFRGGPGQQQCLIATREFAGSANSTIVGVSPMPVRTPSNSGSLQEDLPQHYGIVVRLIMRSEH